MANGNVRLSDGQLDFSAGVDSSRVTTIAGPNNPNGLPRNAVSWANNATMRGGGITQRTGWKRLCVVRTGETRYFIAFSANWNVPEVGITIVITLTRIYPGSNGDQVSIVGWIADDLAAIIGTFEIVSGAGTQTITIKAITIEESAGTVVLGNKPTMSFLVTGSSLAECKIHDSTGIYNGGWMYQQTTALPYLIIAISGQFYRIRVDTDNSIDQITGGTFFPPAQPLYHFVQGLEFMVVQAGDYTTLPLFWDGTTMRQSNGLTGNTAQPGPTLNTFNITAFRTIPAVGATRTWPLASIYPGVVGDQGTLRFVNGSFDIGEFIVTAFNPAAPFDITMQTVASNYIGSNIALGNWTLTVPPVGPPVLINELPAAGPMVYYQGRLWYANFQTYTAGDIVGGPAGTAAYNLRDSILKVTENPLAIGGDGFSIPSQAGNIRALQFVSDINKDTGEGTLFVFTRQQVYGLNAPITRVDWIDSTSSTPPNQRIVQRTNGAVSDRSIVSVNGDLFYQSLDPGIRSLFTSLRYSTQWGNTPISNNIQRALAFNDRELMRFSTGVEFDQRMLQCILPEQRPQGVVHRAIAALDFDPLATLGERYAPNWEGIYEGLDILQLFNGDFGGRERTFAVVVSKEDSSIELWELTNDLRYDNVDTAVQWFIETPAFTWGREFDLKRLDGGELWIDKLFGTVNIKIEYREGVNPCWKLWHFTRLCTARSTCEDVFSPHCYPEELLRESGRFPVVFPVPPLAPCSLIDKRPANISNQFQVKVSISGWCRIRGIVLYAIPVLREPFSGLECVQSPFSP